MLDSSRLALERFVELCLSVVKSTLNPDLAFLRRLYTHGFVVGTVVEDCGIDGYGMMQDDWFCSIKQQKEAF